MTTNMQLPKANFEAYQAMMADPVRRAQLEQVMTDLIQSYKWFMAYGSEAQRMQLIKIALPDMMRARRAEEESSRDQQMRAAYARMREGLAAHIKVNVPDLAVVSAGAA